MANIKKKEQGNQEFNRETFHVYIRNRQNNQMILFKENKLIQSLCRKRQKLKRANILIKRNKITGMILPEL